MVKNNQTVKHIFPVLGMGYASCAAIIEKTLNNMEGVDAATVNFAAATVAIASNPLKT